MWICGTTMWLCGIISCDFLTLFLTSHLYIISHNCGFISCSETLIHTIWHCISQCDCSSHFCNFISYNCWFISHKVTISHVVSQCCNFIFWIILALLSWNVTSDLTVWHYISQCVCIFHFCNFISHNCGFIYHNVTLHTIMWLSFLF